MARSIEQARRDGWVFDEIVSGGARGIDRWGELYAQDHDIPFRRFPAQWKWWRCKCGRTVADAQWTAHSAAHVREDRGGTHFKDKLAGPRRNAEMAAYADALLAIVGQAPRRQSGTHDMIAQARAKGLLVAVVDGDSLFSLVDLSR